MKKFLASVLFLCVTLTSALSFYSEPFGGFAESTDYVPNYLVGDVNGDGVVDGRDSGLLLQYLADILEKICDELDCDFGDIIHYEKNKDGGNNEL